MLFCNAKVKLRSDGFTDGDVLVKYPVEQSVPFFPHDCSHSSIYLKLVLIHFIQQTQERKAT